MNREAPQENVVQGQAQWTMTSLAAGADFMLRNIFLVGEINDAAAYRFLVAFSIMDSTPGDIQVIIHSPGGSEDSGYAIYDAIRHSVNKVQAIGIGSVQSIAAMVFQAADIRSLYPEARFMIHNGSLELDSNIPQDAVIALGKEVEKGNEKYQTILAQRSGATLEKVKGLCEDETYMSAEEAVKANFADRIITGSRYVASPPLKRKKKAK